MLEAAAQLALRSAHAFEAAEHRLAELPDVIGSAVGQGPLGEMPCGFNRIELRGVSGQTLQMQARISSEQIGVLPGSMDGSAIPHEHHMAAQMTQQVVQKVMDLLMADVFVVQAKVKSEPAATRTHRQSSNDGDALAAIVMMQQRRLAARRPGAAHGGNHHESGFVGKDEVGAQPRGVFFIRGHCSCFQRRIFASSRSKARRWGFWQLKPSACSNRATWPR